MSKLKLYTFNMYSLLYVNYSSRSILKKMGKGEIGQCIHAGHSLTDKGVIKTVLLYLDECTNNTWQYCTWRTTHGGM